MTDPGDLFFQKISRLAQLHPDLFLKSQQLCGNKPNSNMLHP